jgi:hypothetical protein
MELSILTGHGPHGLLDQREALVDPAAVVLRVVEAVHRSFRR